MGRTEGTAAPQVSVVVSTYNRRAFLEQALGSVLAQEGVDCEVVVVDNGSSDDTADFLAGVEDPRLRVIRQPETLGATGGRNAGLAAARGQWLGCLDDDDLWAPDKLRAQLGALAESARTWAYTGCVYVDDERRILGGIPPLQPEQVMATLPVRYSVPGGMSSMLWRRDVTDSEPLLDPRLSLTTDWDLSLHLARTGPPAAVMRPLVAFRQHGSNLSHRAGEFQHELDIIEEKFADLRAGQPLDRAGLHRVIGSEALRAGARSAAARAYARAVAGGDTGSLMRAAGLVLPRRLHPLARRVLLTDRSWVQAAKPWVDAIPAHDRRQLR